MTAHLFGWYNLIFYIPLALGILLALGVALGFADMAHGVDVDADADGDIDADADGDGDNDSDASGGLRVLSLLGFGKVPVMLMVMTMLLVFGGTGVICNMAFGRFMALSGGMLALVSAGASLVVTILLTGSFARLVARVMPSMETNATAKRDLIGCIGTVILAFNDKRGVAQVRKGSDLYQIQYSTSDALTKGQLILVTDYEETTNVYDVSLNPNSNA